MEGGESIKEEEGKPGDDVDKRKEESNQGREDMNERERKPAENKNREE